MDKNASNISNYIMMPITRKIVITNSNFQLPGAPLQKIQPSRLSNLWYLQLVSPNSAAPLRFLATKLGSPSAIVTFYGGVSKKEFNHNHMHSTGNKKELRYWTWYFHQEISPLLLQWGLWCTTTIKLNFIENNKHGN